MAREILHQRMMPHLRTRAYPSVCTIQENTPVIDAYGQPIEAWTNLANHENLACSVVPVARASEESKLPEAILEIATHNIYLNGYYPLITPAMQVIMPAEPYDILLSELDSQHRTTKLTVRKVQ